MDWAVLGMSVALRLATTVLAWFTRGLWRETRAARWPRMVASLDIFPPSHGELRFVNAGAGATLDVRFVAEGGEQRRCAEPVVLSGEGQNFDLLSQAD